MDALKKHFIAIVVGVAAIVCYAMGTSFTDEDAQLYATAGGHAFMTLTALLVWAKSKQGGPPSAGTAVALLLATVILAGCAVQPQRKVMQLRKTYIATMDVVTSLYDAGAIDADQLSTFDQFCDVVEAGLDAAQAAADYLVKVKQLDDAAVTDAAEQKFDLAIDAVTDGIKRLIRLKNQTDKDTSHDTSGTRGGVGTGDGTVGTGASGTASAHR
ncbi:MAG TPA: hypothetical protein VGN72_04920 [Tepidisphaeraceae bacterium]|jgi:hypothetical protein|nr:hypothetical protein [Tepidisphaeraceae bacterium]